MNLRCFFIFLLICFCLASCAGSSDLFKDSLNELQSEGVDFNKDDLKNLLRLLYKLGKEFKGLTSIDYDRFHEAALKAYKGMKSQSEKVVVQAQ